jgi:hypothetical protein
VTCLQLVEEHYIDEIMSKHEQSPTKFAICIQSDDDDLLTPRMIYQVLPDESAGKSNYIRVVDNEGEDYLYPADYFMFLILPDEITPGLV